MGTTRLLLRQNSITYRFLRLEASLEGGFTILLDRDAKKSEGCMELKDGTWKNTNGEDRDNQYKVTVHPTGEVHYRSGSKSTPQKSYIDPLHQMVEAFPLTLISIPKISKLDRYEEQPNTTDVANVKDMSEEMNERLTFSIAISPKNSEFTDKTAIARLCSINYEIYSIVICIYPNPVLSGIMENHFLHGGVKHDKFLKPSIGMAEAEIGFYNRIHGDGLKIFRRKDGSYIIITSVPMRIKPILKVEFHRHDLTFEEISILKDGAVDQIKSTYKINFWIRDKGGRNKKSDLSKYIKSISLSSEL